MDVWVDGVPVNLPNAKVYNKEDIFQISCCTSLIAIRCLETGGKAGIVLSANNGLVSDSSWRCTRTYQEGWQTSPFQEAPGVWKYADMFAPNDGTRAFYVPGISPKAQWIWIGPNDGERVYVHCRKVIDKHCS